ncbi:MAG: uroporphyrinogen-III C-methyltransferase, partial [Myxococcales bacterium]|nr:uroporphyrinogen-III C-methyltransferase [Myxococcales bacterium]
MKAPGFVYLVGAGPWAPGLLTLRGRELLARADSVIHDYLVNEEILEFAAAGAERITTGAPGERLGQARVNALMIERARAGQVVVRLKGGDPFVFGRGGEEAEALVAAGVDFEVVPGVTAAVAGAAFAGIPVTHRGYGSTLAFVTGHRAADAADETDWSALARMSTVAVYMGAKRLADVARRLMAAGRAPSTPVALIRWATRPDQETLVSTLADCADAAERAGLAPPLTALIGEVVDLRDRIGWYEQRPLFGAAVVVTRSQGQHGALAGRLAELGAEVLALPTIAFDPCDRAPIDKAIARLGTYDWVIFTSANGVDFFVDALLAADRDPRAFGRARIACIGPATARRLAGRG